MHRRWSLRGDRGLRSSPSSTTGSAYVKEGDKVFADPGGAEGLAAVPAGMEEATIESAEECPGECIFIEVD